MTGVSLSGARYNGGDVVISLAAWGLCEHHEKSRAYRYTRSIILLNIMLAALNLRIIPRQLSAKRK